MVSKGSYIVLEGLDGAGKTTQRDLAQRHIAGLGYETISVIEPGATDIGSDLRGIIKSDKQRSPMTNLALFTADRAELAHQILEPATDRGAIVIADRNWASSYAYQGFGESVDLSLIEGFSSNALGKFLMPRVGIIIDVPTEVALNRVRARDEGSDYFEKKGEEFFEKVRQGYLDFAKKYNWPVVDGDRDITSVHREILAIIGSGGLALPEVVRY